MRKIILGVVAAAAIAGPIAFATSASAAQPTTTTHNVTVTAADEVVYDLPALNSQFTKMTLTASGTAHWGEGIFAPTWDISGQEYVNDAGNEYVTGYVDGNMTSGVHTRTGVAPGWDPLLLEGTQVGALIYKIDDGAWQPLLHTTTITNPNSGTHVVHVAYNERPGLVSHIDNSGSLNLNVVRTKG